MRAENASAPLAAAMRFSQSAQACGSAPHLYAAAVFPVLLAAAFVEAGALLKLAAALCTLALSHLAPLLYASSLQS